jgi:hypothetical protein
MDFAPNLQALRHLFEESAEWRCLDLLAKTFPKTDD